MIPIPETSLADVAARAGLPVEGITALVVLIAPYLVSPLAAVWKRWRKTTGPDTRLVIKWLTALIVGLGGFLLGLYGYDLRGLLNAALAALGAYLKTTGDYERDVNVRAKAARVSAPDVPASQPGDVVTPRAGFQPLFDAANSQGPGQGQDGDGFPSATRLDLPDVPLRQPAPAWLERETAPDLDTGPSRV